jgi:hypothetical protein
VAFIMSVHIAEAAWGLVGWLGWVWGPWCRGTFSEGLEFILGLCLVDQFVLPVSLQGVVLQCKLKVDNAWSKLILLFETSETLNVDSKSSKFSLHPLPYVGHR